MNRITSVLSTCRAATRVVAIRRLPWKTQSIPLLRPLHSTSFEEESSRANYNYSVRSHRNYQSTKDLFTRETLLKIGAYPSGVKQCSSHQLICNLSPRIVHPIIDFTGDKQNNGFSIYHHTEVRTLPSMQHVQFAFKPAFQFAPTQRPYRWNEFRQTSVFPRRRISYTNQMKPLIHKRRTKPVSHLNKPQYIKRRLSSSSSPSSDRISYRDALKSPRKAARYMVQLTYDLVDWAKHMWVGVKLLAADVRVSSKILKRVTQGKQLTRRERNFIVQTGVDLARLVPFSLFLIIPLAEVALPLALRFFPNMLPSQFQTQMKNEENLKKRLKARLELAKYLREVVEEKAKLVQSSDVNSELKKNAEDLTDFLHAIQSGHDVTADEISRFAKFFNDELTIDGAARPQLVAMCKYMGISHYGHESFLRFKLRSRLNAIKNDDMQIMWEGGVDSLTDSEVAKACRDRGIREEVSKKLMRKELNDWLELSQKREIPGSLMIMSRALMYGPTGDRELAEAVDVESEEKEKEHSLKETLGSMPEDVIMDVKQAADRSNVNIQRLEETLRQAKLIELESERIARKEKEDEERKKREEEEEEETAGEVVDPSIPELGVEIKKPEDIASAPGTEAIPMAMSSSAASSKSSSSGYSPPSGIESIAQLSSAHKTGDIGDSSISSEQVIEKVEEYESKLRDEMMAPSSVSNDKDRKDSVSTLVEEEEEELKKRERIRAMLISLGQLSSDSSVEAEREELRNLKIEQAEAEQKMKDIGGEDAVGMEMRRLKSLMRTLEREVERVDAKVGLGMKLLDHDNDGVMSLDECRHAMILILGGASDSASSLTDEQVEENQEIVNTTLQRLDADADGNISRADLARLLHEMQFEYGLVDEISMSNNKSINQKSDGIPTPSANPK